MAALLDGRARRRPRPARDRQGRRAAAASAARAPRSSRPARWPLACAEPARADGRAGGHGGAHAAARRPARAARPAPGHRGGRGAGGRLPRAGASGCSSTSRGPFALVVWDARARRGLLAQDQLGGRSLFTFHDGPRLCFATEIGVLLALLRRRPDPDELALAHHLVEHSVPDGRMLYQGVRRLGGGCLLELSDAGRAERRYWTPRYRAAAAGAAGRARRPAARRAGGGRRRTRCRGQPRRPAAQRRTGLIGRRRARGPARPRPAGDRGRASPSRSSTRRAWARRVADDTGLALTTVAIEQREPLDAAEAYLRAWELPLPTPGILIEAPLIAAAARLGAARRARRPGRRRALRRGALPHRRPRAAPATAVGLAAFAPAPVAGRRPAAASRPARVHERRRPRRARARRSTSRSAGGGPRRATRPRGCAPAPPSSIATARTRGAGSSSTGRAGGPIWPTP